jgi:dihydroflavonol-4-reductase
MGFSVVSREWGRISGKPPLMTPPGLRTMHARLHLDSAKAQAELGIAFRPLQETLADTVAWFRQNGYD